MTTFTRHFQACTPIRMNVFFFCSCLFLFLSGFHAVAQPSGGPYGPIAQVYELPTDAKQIYYVAPDGQTNAEGNAPDKPTTLAEAIKRVKTGDAIVMREGIYRTGGLLLNQGITIQPYMDEQPILKGTQVATEWVSLGKNLWKTTWPTLFPDKPADWWRRERNGALTPLHRFNNDMVFVNGRFLQSAGWEGEVDENSFFVNYETGDVFIGTDPKGKLVEITAFDSALIQTVKECHGKTSDSKGPVVRGITFTQYAYRALEVEGAEPEGLAKETDFGKDIVGTTFEHCTITFCSRAAGYFRGDGFTMRYCLVSDTSTEGVYVISSADILLEKNIFRRNNIENITGYYPAAVKIFNQCYRATCRDNLVIDHPNSNGIWYDVGEVDGVFIDNWLQDIGFTDTPTDNQRPWPSCNAFFFEISKGAVCAGNVFVNCDHGIFVLNSSNVQMYQNTCINSTVCIRRDARSDTGDHFGWHPSTGPDVDNREGHIFANNLLMGDEHFTRPLLAISQLPALCDRLSKPQLKTLDYNILVRHAETDGPMLYWSPAQKPDCQMPLNSLEQLHKEYSDFAEHSQSFTTYHGPLFKNFELGNYELQNTFSEFITAGQLPMNIRELLGLSNKIKAYVGAYPPQP